MLWGFASTLTLPLPSRPLPPLEKTVSSLFLFPLMDRHVVRPLRALIDPKGPEQLHLEGPPTCLPMGCPGAHLSSAQGCKPYCEL